VLTELYAEWTQGLQTQVKGKYLDIDPEERIAGYAPMGVESHPYKPDTSQDDEFRFID